MRVGPKSAKRQCWLDCLFAYLWSTKKAALKHWWNWPEVSLGFTGVYVICLITHTLGIKGLLLRRPFISRWVVVVWCGAAVGYWWSCSPACPPRPYRCQFHQRFTCSFYAGRSQKCQMTLLTCLSSFAHSGSTCVKAVHRTLMKLSPGLLIAIVVVVGYCT